MVILLWLDVLSFGYDLKFWFYRLLRGIDCELCLYGIVLMYGLAQMFEMGATHIVFCYVKVLLLFVSVFMPAFNVGVLRIYIMKCHFDMAVTTDLVALWMLCGYTGEACMVVWCFDSFALEACELDFLHV
eukprot:gene3083-2065_t